MFVTLEGVTWHLPLERHPLVGPLDPHLMAIYLNLREFVMLKISKKPLIVFFCHGISKYMPGPPYEVGLVKSQETMKSNP